jgi:hypothetical protein
MENGSVAPQATSQVLGVSERLQCARFNDLIEQARFPTLLHFSNTDLKSGGSQ